MQIAPFSLSFEGNKNFLCIFFKRKQKLLRLIVLQNSTQASPSFDAVLTPNELYIAVCPVLLHGLLFLEVCWNAAYLHSMAFIILNAFQKQVA